MGFELTVRRADAYMLKGRRFHVEVDGVEVGTLRRRGNLAVPMTEGEHRVRVFVGDPGTSLARSEAVTVRADSVGSASLVARPSDADPASRTDRHARREPFALELVEGDDVTRVGPTFMQVYRSRQPSLGAPARTPAERMWWLMALLLGLAGFVLLPIASSGIGLALLAAAAVITTVIRIRYLRERRRN